MTQTVKGQDPGIYILKAVAQNIQQDKPTVKQTGACLFGAQSETPVQTAGEYTLQFTNIDSCFNMGFRAANATGNCLAWIISDCIMPDGRWKR